MNIDLTKYLKNKDIKFKNEDFDLDSLGKDLTKEATKGYVAKDTYDTDIKKAGDDLKKANDDWTKKYTDLESNYNGTVQKLSDTNNSLSKVTLEKIMISKGFKEDKFDEISKLRTSLFADEKDDVKAIEGIADRFKGTYFPDPTPAKPAVPNEAGFNGGVNQGTNNGNPTKIDRNTPLANMFIGK